MKKIYLFLADGFEEVEALTVVDLLRRANIDVKTISINKEKNVIGRSGINVISDLIYDENMNFDDGDGIGLPGGAPGFINLQNHTGVTNLLKEYFEKSKLICAICAAPTVLGSIGILKDKKAVCFPGMENMLNSKEIGNSGTVIDDNIITSKGIGTAIEFSLAIIEKLLGDTIKNQISESIVYKI